MIDTLLLNKHRLERDLKAMTPNTLRWRECFAKINNMQGQINQITIYDDHDVEDLKRKQFSMLQELIQLKEYSNAWKTLFGMYHYMQGRIDVIEKGES